MINSKQFNGALDGIRVLDLATFIAAPYAAGIMGEFGADVIKIEQPGTGDPLRQFGTATELDGQSLCWLSEGRNKQSVTLNLKSEQGADIFKKLVAQSDVVCENFRPGTLEKWGLGWDQLKLINPKLVLLRVSGYGQTGPYAARPGFARVAHAVGGLSHLSGQVGERPVTPGSTSLADYMTGLYGAVGVLMALRHRDQTGVGQIIDIGLYESVFRVLDEIAPAYAMHGTVRAPEGSGTVNACPHGHFKTLNKKWIAIACTTDKMFARLCQAMGGAGQKLSQNYGDQATRLKARDVVNDIVEKWTSSMTREDVLNLCEKYDVPSGPLNDIADIFEDPQFKARGNLQTVPVDGIGNVIMPGVIPKMSLTPGQIKTPGPALGNATDQILKNLLQMTKDECQALRDTGVI